MILFACVYIVCVYTLQLICQKEEKSMIKLHRMLEKNHSALI